MFKFLKAVYRAFKHEYMMLNSERIATKISNEIAAWEDMNPKPQWEPKEGEYWLDVNMDVFDAIPFSEEEEKEFAMRHKKPYPFKRAG